ncbi:MAG: hypothetical protein AMXMBFR58_14810 [Phycisphaerae bacterium]
MPTTKCAPSQTAEYPFNAAQKLALIAAARIEHIWQASDPPGISTSTTQWLEIDPDPQRRDKLSLTVPVETVGVIEPHTVRFTSTGRPSVGCADNMQHSAARIPLVAGVKEHVISQPFEKPEEVVDPTMARPLCL